MICLLNRLFDLVKMITNEMICGISSCCKAVEPNYSWLRISLRKKQRFVINKLSEILYLTEKYFEDDSMDIITEDSFGYFAKY